VSKERILRNGKSTELKSFKRKGGKRAFVDLLLQSAKGEQVYLTEPPRRRKIEPLGGDKQRKKKPVNPLHLRKRHPRLAG